MNLQDLVEDLNSMILKGQIMEAIEKYYHEDVIMQENEQTPTVGKAANREREKDWLLNVIEFRGAEVKAVAVGDNVTMVEWFFDYTHKEWGKKTYHQVAVQRWNDGKIIHERFYYGS
ncbi:MAG: nuclear transport factor 2 family protein [Candidatus Dadabacteria bacterium]|nr:nuclear transport factor 2 family protein [Candidatus Dadabacteria bacterium]